MPSEALNAVKMDDSVPAPYIADPPEPVATVETSTASEKAYTILGTEAMPPKLQQRLGSLDPEAAILARQADKLQREKELQRVVNQLPTTEQLKIPSNAEIPLPEKALDVLGSEELKEMSRNAVPNKTKIKNLSKLVAILGELEITSEKAQQVLGSVDEADRAVLLANLELEREALAQKQHNLQRVLSAPVSSSQLELPPAARVRGLHEDVVSLKALELMGEETLNKAVREHVPDNLKVKPKAMTVLGDAKTMPSKARTVLGDLRNDVAARVHADEELATEIARDTGSKSDTVLEDSSLAAGTHAKDLKKDNRISNDQHVVTQ